MLTAGKVATAIDPRVELISLNISDPSHPWIRRAHDFGSHYVHFSTNPEAFEMVAIQRWFVLNELMRARNFSRVLFIDSDVLLVTNATLEQLCYGDCDMVTSSIRKLKYSGAASPHTSFWSADAMAHFTDFIYSAYTLHISRIRAFWDGYLRRYESQNKSVWGGFNDMTLSAWFAQHLLAHPELGLSTCNSAAPITTAGTFDHKRGYELLQNFRQNDLGLPELLHNGHTVRLKSLHFQGAGKLALVECGFSSTPESLGAQYIYDN